MYKTSKQLAHQALHESEDSRKNWTSRYSPLLAGGAAALGVYGLARHPFKSKNPILQKIRELSKGKMYFSPRVSRETWERTPEWKKTLRTLVYGPQVHPEVPGEVEAALKKRPGGVFVPDPRVVDYLPSRVLRPELGGTITPVQQRGQDQRLVDLMDKAEQAKFFERYVPGTMAKTLTPQDIVSRYGLGVLDESGKIDLNKLQYILKNELGGQYIIKPRGAVTSTFSGTLPTEKTDLTQALASWQKLKPEYEREVQRGASLSMSENATDAVKKFRTNPAFTGKAIEDIFSNDVIFQNRLPIEEIGALSKKRYLRHGWSPNKEYRIHVMGGKAIPYLSMPRFGGLHPANIPEWFRAQRAARWAHKNVIDKLPEDYRSMAYSLDVAKLEGGGHAVIEANPGPYSGLLREGFNPLLHKTLTGRFAPQHAATLGVGGGLLSGGGVGLATSDKAASFLALPPKKKGLLAAPPQLTPRPIPNRTVDI